MTWDNRIVGHGEESPDDLLAHPKVCACGCGREVRHPSASLIKGHRVGEVPPPPKRVPAECAFCGVRITVERWRVEKFGADHVYCSRDHAAAQRAKDARVEFTCEWCGQMFSLKGSRKRGAHAFCSHVCAMQFRVAGPHDRAEVSCAQCGHILLVHPSRALRSDHSYCSRECRARFIMGTNNPAYRSGMGRKREYASNWKSQRRRALIRDEERCQECGSESQKSRSLHVHHIVPAYRFEGDWERANVLENLVTLCPPCHKTAEAAA